MNEAEIFLAGAIGLVSLIAFVVKPQKWFKRKNQKMDYSAFGINIPYIDPYVGYDCPKCNKGWKYDDNHAPKYCECDEFPVGHFHLECAGLGKNGKSKSVGCGVKFIMPSKDHK